MTHPTPDLLALLALEEDRDPELDHVAGCCTCGAEVEVLQQVVHGGRSLGPRVRMGVLSGTSARFPVPAAVHLSTHPIVDVCLEPPGVTDPAHSGTSVVRGLLAL